MARRFANYPLAQEGPHVEYAPHEEANPVLRGLPLSIAASVISVFPSIQRKLWDNAGFGTVRNVRGIAGLPVRFDPCVTTLSPSSDNVAALPLSPAQVTPPPASLPGRYHTCADFYAAYSSGATTPLEVVSALIPLTRRDGANPSPSSTPALNRMFVSSHGLGEDTAFAAARASTERWASGRPLSPLDGVPFAVKDDTQVRGWVTHFGMRYDQRRRCFEPATETEWHVQKLEEAGAIMVAKTNMHELGSDTSGCNPIWGTPPNWHNNAYYPGGSSSGSASACSVGMFPITIGGDAGGSLRIPAAFNGLYTIKPSHHRCATLPSSMAVAGPLAATVQDLVLAYRTMAQQDPTCPVRSHFTPSIPPSLSPHRSGRQIGIYRAWWDRADVRVTEACDRAVAWFAAERGYELVPIYIPHVDVGQLAHGGTCLAEMADSARTRANSASEWLSLVTPATRLLLMLGSQTPAVDYLRYAALRELLMRHMAHLYKKHPGLLVVTPTTTIPGWQRNPGDDTHGVSDGNTTVCAMTYIWLANTTGCPAVSAPVGYVDPDVGEGRLPVGLMAMAEWGEEEQLLEWAGEAEEYLHQVVGRVRPKGWMDVLAS